ncbi:recombinase family protein [Fictibacillus sp. S7]|uniref:recombinase family protein n=1 Tax=Fictibacillus sp. S7 TaxID=2212476 RepID=UPI001010931A|nr:recombinase family protein [Fictibacillus sp. S7]RXY98545.1 recombinase [Fictibacillus sp. S7]
MSTNDYIKNVAIYLRASRDEEKKGIEETLDTHRRRLTKLCNERNWKHTIYQEIGSSQNINEQLNAMLEKLDEYDAVVVHATDRLGRNKLAQAQVQETIKRKRVLLVTPDRIYDLNSTTDSLYKDMEDMFSAHEYMKIRERLMNGKNGLSEKGLWAHGKPPLGYDKDTKTRKLVPNEQAKHIHFIFNSLIEGKTVSEVFTALNNMGVKTKTGSKFNFRAIERIVNNEAYKGTLVYHQYESLDEYRKDQKRKKTKQRPKDEWKRIPDAHTAIIDEVTWEKANRIVNTYAFAAPRAKNSIYPTTKLLRCGVCGKFQGAQFTEKVQKYYLKSCTKCGNQAFPYLPVMKMIKEEVTRYSKGFVEVIKLAEQADNTNHNEYQRTQINKQIQVAERALDKLLPLYEEDEITLNQFRERKKKREEEIEHLQKELEKLKKENPEVKLATLQDMKKHMEYLMGNWEIIDGEGMTNEQLNRSLHILIEQIDWTYPKGEDVAPKLNIKFIS